jgi:hypothetical protein
LPPWPFIDIRDGDSIAVPQQLVELRALTGRDQAVIDDLEADVPPMSQSSAWYRESVAAFHRKTNSGLKPRPQERCEG